MVSLLQASDKSESVLPGVRVVCCCLRTVFLFIYSSAQMFVDEENALETYGIHSTLLPLHGLHVL